MSVSGAFLTRWLLIMVIGVGVIAMHSMPNLGGCSAGVPMNTPMMAGHMPMIGVAGSPGDRTGNIVAAAAGDSDAFRGVPPRPPAGRGMSIAGHLCLAVLDALGYLLVALLLLIVGYRSEVAPVVDPRAVGTRRSRAPPPRVPPELPSLLELCVSRR